MSKIICEFCGTSYSEAATQCPICGCVRPAEDSVMLGVLEEPAQEHEYHYVKGGRFSEKNVRKRNAVGSPAASRKLNKDEKEPSNKGLVIIIFVLLVAIAAVIVYIALTFFGPDYSVNDLRDEVMSTITSMEDTEDLSCKEIRLAENEIVLEEIGIQFPLNPTLIPSNTNEQCTYFTDNDAVATVNASGVVTAISSGEATVTIRCGEVSVACKIVVSEPVVPFTLDFVDITFNAAGDSCVLYSGEISPEEIIWASEDEAIAIVHNGNVIAVGPGVTKIYASYNGESATCMVNCVFEEETTEAPTEETQETIVDNGPYQLKNAYGFSNSDVTIRIGESFTLILIDKDGNKVDGVSWTVSGGNSCSVKDGVVTGDSAGKSTVVATYNGKEYTCIVRVS